MLVLLTGKPFLRGISCRKNQGHKNRRKVTNTVYIIKNALRCIGRSKGRNVLIGIIVLVIAGAACIGLSIRQAAQSAKEETLSGMSVTATISVDRQAMMGDMGGGASGEKFDKDRFFQMMGDTSSLTLEEYQKYAQATSVENFYYTVTIGLDGDSISPVSDEASTDSTDTDALTSSSGEGRRPEGGMGGMGGFSMNSGDFTIICYSADNAMTAFVNGTATVQDGGAVFAEGTENYDCIISSELAIYNDLAVGDTISLINPNSEEEVYELTVVGIYTDNSTNENFQQMTGRGFSDPANEIYMSSNAVDKILAASAAVSTTVTDEDTDRETETKLTETLSCTYVFADTEAYYAFEEEVRTLGLSEDYTVSSSDISSFENSLVPLETLGKMAGWFLLVILIIGAVILIVLNIFNVRERKYEIGVLTAMGMKKGKVAMQFLTEIFAVTMAAVTVGVVIGAISAVPVTNALLENQIASTQSQSAQMDKNFGRENGGSFGGRGDGNMPSMGAMPSGGNIPEMPDDGKGFIGNIFGESAANYVSEIDSAMNFTVVWQMLGIAVLLTLISGAASMLFVMRYEPLKILANRD